MAAREGVGIAARAADQAIVARAVGEAVVAVEAIDVVVAGALNVAERPRAHRGAIPHSAVGKGHDQPVVRARIGAAQRVAQDQAIARARKRDDQVVAVRPGADRRENIGKTIVGQANLVLPGTERVDPIVAVAAAIDVDVVAALAREEVRALAADQRVGSGGALDQVVAIARRVGEQARGDVGQRKHFAGRGEQDRFDPARTGQRIEQDQLVAIVREGDDQVAGAARTMDEMEVGKRVARNLHPVGRRGRVVLDRVAAVAAGKAIDVVPAPADQHVAAQFAREHVGVAVAEHHVVEVGGDPREQVRLGQDRAVGEAHGFDPAATQRLVERDPALVVADHQHDRAAIARLFDADVAQRDPRREDQAVARACGVRNDIEAVARRIAVFVVARAAEQPVEAQPTVENIVAIERLDPVVPARATQHVGSGGPEQAVVARARRLRHRHQRCDGPHRAVGEPDRAHAHRR